MKIPECKVGLRVEVGDHEGVVESVDPPKATVQLDGAGSVTEQISKLKAVKGPLDHVAKAPPDRLMAEALAVALELDDVAGDPAKAREKAVGMMLALDREDAVEQLDRGLPPVMVPASNDGVAAQVLVQRLIDCGRRPLVYTEGVLRQCLRRTFVIAKIGVA